MNTRTETTTEDRLEGIKSSVKGLVDQGQQKVDELRTRVVDVKAKAMTNGRQFVDRAAGYIKANPFKAVGIAFGVGYIGMRLFRR